MKVALAFSLALGLASMPGAAHADAVTPPQSSLDARIEQLMHENQVNGLALAITEGGSIREVHAFGDRDAHGNPLTDDTIMYGASLTKATFAYAVAQLAAEGKIGLDTPIAEYLPRPLPDYTDAEDKYAPWQNLAGDERWRRLTPRILLNHASGFANFYWLEPDKRLQFHFEPGTRYAYSGDGIILLQFVLETGLGLDLEKEMEQRVFVPFGMTRSSLIWRDGFSPNLADGWTEDGSPVPHDERSQVRAAGSLDTTISDMARFSADVMGGPEQLWREMARPQLPIRSAVQFPSLQPDAPEDKQVPNLSAGLGVVTFEGPQGPGFFKGGHNDSTGNMWVCLERGRRCVVLLGNDVRAERIYPQIVKLVLGDTGLPWRWEYSNAGWLAQ